MSCYVSFVTDLSFLHLNRVSVNFTVEGILKRKTKHFIQLVNKNVNIDIMVALIRSVRNCNSISLNAMIMKMIYLRH